MWILSLILIDFGFYWFHRACHGKWNNPAVHLLVQPPTQEHFHHIHSPRSGSMLSIAPPPLNLSLALCLSQRESYWQRINSFLSPSCHLGWLTHLTFYSSSLHSTEINFLWATHQVHHSSQHFNLSTALRQSVPQLYLHTVSNRQATERERSESQAFAKMIFKKNTLTAAIWRRPVQTDPRFCF